MRILILAPILVFAHLAYAEGGFISTTEDESHSAKAAPAPVRTEKPTSVKESEPPQQSSSDDDNPIECAKNLTEFRSNPHLTAIYGPRYNPYSHWSPEGFAQMCNCVSIDSNAPGELNITVDYNGHHVYHLVFEICANVQTRERFAMSNGKKYHFDDRRGNRMTLSNNGKSGTFDLDANTAR